mgnify:CR=1 FL=1
MKRFLGCAVAMLFALVAIALLGGDTGAVAGHGCHGRAKCHGRQKCHGERHGRHKKNRCHGQEAPACCGEVSGCAGGACGGEAVISEGVPTEAAPVAPAAPAKT